jgi:uncharacterized membrane protein YozB (DUF420 family)
MFYNILAHIHSITRWLVLITIILAIVYAIVGLIKGGNANEMKCRQNRFAFLLTHIQLLIGLVLYFISPKVIFAGESMKDPLLRFFLVEHIALMLVAVVLVTIGFIKFQKAELPQQRHKITVIYYGIALLLMLVSIPWPFRNLGGGWY